MNSSTTAPINEIKIEPKIDPLESKPKRLNIIPPMKPPTRPTIEAKLCPDGSYVGRRGPNCEFAECTGAQKPQQIFCTQEVKQCADGSYVRRMGPNCDFAPCY